MEELNVSSSVTPSPVGKGRKKERQPEKYKTNVAKRMRHMPHALPEYPTCGHDGRPGQPYYCTRLTMKQIKEFHAKFYQSNDKIEQDTFILACCKGNKPKRGKRRAQVSIQYHIRLNGGELMRVCRQTFLGVTNVSKDRVQRILRNFVNQGATPKERRGGDRVRAKNNEKRTCIKNYIESLNCTESHYCRSKTSVRIYLPCDLNFKKLYNMYLQRVPENMHVIISYFRKYVNAHYNMAFGTPQTDCCSTCLRIKEMLKMTTSAETRQRMVTEHRVHVIKAKTFFKLLKHTKPRTASFSFDCQKNLALPRLPDQAAYFSQQLNFYNFTVVSGNSKTQLKPANVFSYVWTAIDYQKDSNAIASAVQHVLNNFEFEDSVEKVNLFADGCGGQNKNTIMMSMLAYWLLKESPRNIKTVEITFPIVGHSFIPPDRVFRLIEKDIKQTPVIVEPSHYVGLIKKHATVRQMGVDWKLYDWRTETKKVIKPPGSWHFEFNKAKRFIIVKKENSVLVQGEPNYSSDIGRPKGICKKNYTISSMSPSELPLGKKLKGDKTSIGKLLAQHYGTDWRRLPELNFYKIYLSNKFAAAETDDAASERCQNQDDNLVI